MVLFDPMYGVYMYVLIKILIMFEKCVTNYIINFTVKRQTFFFCILYMNYFIDGLMIKWKFKVVSNRTNWRIQIALYEFNALNADALSFEYEFSFQIGLCDAIP